MNDFKRSLLLLLTLTLLCTHSSAQQAIDLSGEWQVQVERKALDIQSAFVDRALVGSVHLPGSMQAQEKGDPVRVDSPWTMTLSQVDFFNAGRYAPYRDPNNFKTSFCLQPKTMYVGGVWYQRKIEVPDEWADRRVVLRLERPHWVTEAWIDGKRLGKRVSLSTPHEYELPDDLPPGGHTLTLRVDNSMHVAVGIDAHSVSDNTQGNWNGIVGAIELYATPKVWIERVRIMPNVEKKKIVVDAVVGNETEGPADVVLEAVASLIGSDQSLRGISSGGKTIPAGGGAIQMEYPLGDDAKLWDEFSPSVYDLQLTLSDGSGKKHLQTARFGLREGGTKGTQITINDRPVFLRGTLECCVFPLTGYPPTDKESWLHVYKQCQAFGLNHVRFHSYCPPKAAFEAADEVGIYLQVEAAAWAHVGNGDPIDQWLIDETERILAEYGNHPSFILAAYGNEPHPNKPSRDRYLANWVRRFQKADPRFLYTTASGWPLLPVSDFHVPPNPRIQQWGEGLKSSINSEPPSTTRDYRDFVARFKQPVVAHEIGQWCAYPDLDERSKYTGALSAENFDIFEDFLVEQGLRDQAEDFLMASGALQELCYKADIEAALRTPGFGGFQLLGLNDFPGQGTALVGLLDPFWDAKVYASADRFREFCAPTVPLVRLDKRIFTPADTLTGKVQVAHYGSEDIENSRWQWRLSTGDQEIARGELAGDRIATGDLTTLGEFKTSLASVAAPAECELVVSQVNGDAVNRWRVWVYPTEQPTDTAEVLVVQELNEPTLAALEQGKVVVLLPDPARVKTDVVLGFSSIFWNTSWTENQPPHTLGVLCEADHPALAGFPNRGHSDWQWWEVVHNARTMELDALPRELEPLVQIVPDWFKPQKLALAFEAKVADGKLLVCSADLRGDLPQRHAARAFKQSLLRYAASDAFEPSVELTAEQLQSLFAEPSDAAQGN